MRLQASRFVLALALLAVAPALARAHGLHGHVHVTGWAIDSLPPGELRTILEDPEVRAAALMGAAFPDTGYAVIDSSLRDRARAYAEHAHWEPFVQDFVAHVRATYAPPYDTREERLVIAFLLGVASHGLQDELFDSTILHECEQRDGAGQDATDPGTDGFLFQDGYAWMLPGDFVPFDDLLVLYRAIPEDVDRPLMENGIRLVKGAYLNATIGPRIALQMAERYREVIPWTADHYLDPAVPGSLRAEITPTARYMEAIWERLHGREREEDLIIHAWPAAPRRLREADAESVASWVTIVLGRGILDGDRDGTFTGDGDAAHPFRLAGTRWGGTARLLRFQPTEDLTPGAFYTVTLQPGARLVDGTTTELAHAHGFQVECDDEVLCPPVEVEDPNIDPPPPPPPSDAGPRPSADAGAETPPPASAGCACAVGARSSGARSWLAVLALLALLARSASRRVDRQPGEG